MTTPIPDREALARIIDEKAWASFDRLMRQADAGRFDDGEAMSPRQAASIREDAPGLIKDSLAKADQWLARSSGGGEADDRFWLVLHEPGEVPEVKGSWPVTRMAKTLREFIAARPHAYIDVLTWCCGEPMVEHGPEALQIMDGRSMGVGRKHNARTREAHARFHALAALPPPAPSGVGETDAQIKHMVDRFLGWTLPDNFNPDGGVSFKRTFNDHLATPTKYNPSGTNLFDATQATAMVRHMVEGLPPAPAPLPSGVVELKEAAEEGLKWMVCPQYASEADAFLFKMDQDRLRAALAAVPNGEG